MTGRMIQTAIVTVLMFVLMFGIGFILNMLLKTTWLPLYLYIVLVIGTVVWFWTKEDTSLWVTVRGFAIPDYMAAIGGLAGAWLTGTTIHTLRVKGFKMF
jgi:hypothetical protein